LNEVSLDQGFSNLFVLRPTFKKFFQCDSTQFNAIESLDVNDTSKHPITNLKTHFCLWPNHANAHNPQK